MPASVAGGTGYFVDGVVSNATSYVTFDAAMVSPAVA